jgi:hypothetical protein
MDESDKTRLMGGGSGVENDATHLMGGGARVADDPDATVYARPGENPDATVYAPPVASRTAAAPRRAPEPVRNAVPSPSQTSYYGYGYDGAAGGDGRGARRGPNLKRITLVLVGALVALIVFAVVSSCVSDAVSSVAAGASSDTAPRTTTTGTTNPEPTSSTSGTDTDPDLGGIADTLGDAATTAREVAQNVGGVAKDLASKLPSQVKGLLSSR